MPGATTTGIAASGRTFAPRWSIAWAQRLRRRLVERSFWLVQAGVLLVSAANWLVRALTDDSAHDSLVGYLVHVPVLLYIVPVAYAALRYGSEGGLLTGAWAALLAAPTALVYHREGFAWVGELLLLAPAVGFGAVVALVVERERRHRFRAEQAASRASATGKRLSLLSDTASLLVANEQLSEGLSRVLERLMHLLDLSAAIVVVAPAGGDEARIEVACGRSDAVARAKRLAPLPHHLPSGTVWRVEDVAAVPLAPASGDRRALVVTGTRIQWLTDRDQELLETVAIQVGAAGEFRRLRTQQEQRWRRYVQQATRAQEEERRRIARELHDVAVHELLLISRRLIEVADDPDIARRIAEQVADVQQRVGAVTAELRRFSGELRPSVLSHLGLPAALEWLTTELGRRSCVQAGPVVEGQPRRLSDEDELALFRIAEEALRNVERHAGAASVSLRLRFRQAQVDLEIADDGVGFDQPTSLEDFACDGSLGLLGMRERAESSGGTLRIESAPGAGTRISVSLPDSGHSNRAGEANPPRELADSVSSRRSARSGPAPIR